MSIKRYDMDGYDASLDEHRLGYYVTYDDHNAAISAKDAEIAALRERCGRLANEVMAWRRHDAAFTLIVGVAEVNRLLSFDTFYRTSGEVCEAMQQVKDHNDLAPPKGDNDG